MRKHKIQYLAMLAIAISVFLINVNAINAANSESDTINNNLLKDTELNELFDTDTATEAETEAKAEKGKTPEALNRQTESRIYNAKVARVSSSLDSDNDGCSDVFEEKINNTSSEHTDRLDCSNFSLGLNKLPEDIAELAVEEFGMKDSIILNLFLDETYGDYGFLIPGYINLNSNEELINNKVCFTVKDSGDSMIDIGCTKVSLKQDEVVPTNRFANFLLFNEQYLPDGQYDLIAYAKTKNGNILKTLTYNIVIDSSAVELPISLTNFSGVKLNGQVLDPAQPRFEKISLRNGKVYAVFTTSINSNVEVYWNSELSVSSALSDSSKGEVYIEVPSWFKTEKGEVHKMSAFAYSLDNPNAKSKPIILTFGIEDSNLWIFILAGLTALLIILIFINMYFKNKKQDVLIQTEEKQKKSNRVMFSGLLLIVSFFVLPVTISAATFTVDSSLDSTDFNAGDGFCDIDDGAGDGPCTLRAAIEEGNFDVGTDTIEFNGAMTIQPTSAFPTIVTPISIEGVYGSIEIDGSNHVGVTSPIIFGAGSEGSSLISLIFNRYQNIAIVKIEDVNITINNNAFGFDTTGMTTYSNVSTGIEISADYAMILNNKFGGLARAIMMWGADNATIAGNIIGVAADNVTGAEIQYDALDLSDSNNNTIGTTGSPNIIGSAGGAGIGLLATSTGNTIGNNYIGYYMGDLPNRWGVYVEATATGNNIGSPSLYHNTIASNTEDGIFSQAQNTIIKNNYIGTDGTNDLGNGQNGIEISASNVTIGGPLANEGNIISGNTGVGIGITSALGASTSIDIFANKIGTGINGTENLGNGSHGILVDCECTVIQIGGQSEEYQNLITHNANGIILPVSGSKVEISGNKIYANGTYNLDLDDNGVDTNDSQDADSGANGGQNYPIISSATAIGANITIEGTLNSLASSAFDLEFFYNTTGEREGSIYLGFTTVITDGNGDATFSASVSADGIEDDGYITATATATGTGSTSEFSAPLAFDFPISYCISATRVEPSVYCFGNTYYESLDEVMGLLDGGENLYIDEGTWTSTQGFYGDINYIGYSDVAREDVILENLLYLDRLTPELPQSLSFTNLTLVESTVGNSSTTIAFDNVVLNTNGTYCFTSLNSVPDSIITFSNVEFNCEFEGVSSEHYDINIEDSEINAPMIFGYAQAAADIIFSGNTVNAATTLLLAYYDTDNITIENNNFTDLFHINIDENSSVGNMIFSGNSFDLGNVLAEDQDSLFATNGESIGVGMIRATNLTFTDNSSLNYDYTASNSIALTADNFVDVSGNSLPTTTLALYEQTPTEDDKLIHDNILRGILPVAFTQGTTKIYNNQFWNHGTITIALGGYSSSDIDFYNNILYSGANGAGIVNLAANIYGPSTINFENNVIISQDTGEIFTIDSSPFQTQNIKNNYIAKTTYSETLSAMSQCREQFAFDGTPSLPLVFENNFINSFDLNLLGNSGNVVLDNLFQIADSGAADTACTQYVDATEGSTSDNSWITDYNQVRSNLNSLNYSSDIPFAYEEFSYGTVTAVNDQTISTVDSSPPLGDYSGRFVYLYNEGSGYGFYFPILSFTAGTLTIADTNVDLDTITSFTPDSYKVVEFELEAGNLTDSGTTSVSTLDKFDGQRPQGNSADIGISESGESNAAPSITNLLIDGDTDDVVIAAGNNGSITVTFDYSDPDNDDLSSYYLYAVSDTETLILNHSNVFVSEPTSYTLNFSLAAISLEDGDEYTISAIVCDERNRCSTPTTQGQKIYTYQDARPVVTATIDGESNPLNICSLNPAVNWNYFDANNDPQIGYIVGIFSSDQPSEETQLFLYQGAGTTTTYTPNFDLSYGSTYYYYMLVGNDNASDSVGPIQVTVDSEVNCTPVIPETPGGGGGGGTNTDGDDTDGDDGEETPGDETPGDETPGDETPGDDAPESETPTTDNPSNEVPVTNEPTNDIEPNTDNNPETTVEAEDTDEDVADVIEQLIEESSNLGANLFNDPVAKPNYGENFKTFVDGSTMTLSPSFNDIDRDGCSDRVELQLTKSNVLKFNGFGIGDCDLNYVWGVEQEDMFAVLQSGEDFISLNLSDDSSKNVFASPEHLIFMGGVYSQAPANEKVKVEFSIKNLTSGLTYNLGAVTSEFVQLSSESGYQALFSYLNKFNFPDGEYELIALANLSKNNTATAKRIFTINSNIAQTDLEVIDFSGFKLNPFENKSSISDLKFDIDSSGNAYVYGQTNFNNKVVAAWNSVLLTSVVMADSSSGKFYVEPRTQLPPGDHTVVLYAENLDDNSVKSKPIAIEFNVKSNFEKSLILIRNILILLTIIFGSYAFVKRTRANRLANNQKNNPITYESYNEKC